jgi:hypothetical protein
MSRNTLGWDEVILAREIEVAELATKELRQASVFDAPRETFGSIWNLHSQIRKTWG